MLRRTRIVTSAPVSAKATAAAVGAKKKGEEDIPLPAPDVRRVPLDATLSARLQAMEDNDSAISQRLLQQHRDVERVRADAAVLLRWIDGCAQIATLSDGEIARQAKVALREAVLAPTTYAGQDTEKNVLFKHLTRGDAQSKDAGGS
uniref:Uncharacterized protein n=1 Tax=Neobodo designis TaxID=312471 RepID=A0A7S1KY27_NEODS|mmetsp:Transcript_11115/g.34496  ORF Transcript_11115/g.34496 Transcript_11115/m.34496 type:complete len:147 (+) Transcript_11115:53-493(+)